MSRRVGGKTNKNTKHLCNQPPIARDSRPVFEKFLLRALDIVHDVLAVIYQSGLHSKQVRGYLRVGINALDHVCLLADHGCELPKDGAQLIDG